MIGEKYFDVAIFFDFMIILWSFYAFSMILSLSDDIIGKTVSSKFHEVSTTYLYISFILLAFLSGILFYSAFPIRTIFAALFIPVVIGFYAIRKLRRIKKPFKLNFKPMVAKIKSNLYQLFFSIFIVCLIMIVLGNFADLTALTIFFVVGSVALIGFLIAKERTKRP